MNDSVKYLNYGGSKPMWKKIIMDVLSVFKDNVFKHIFPKYRARAKIRDEVKKNIYPRFSDCFNSQKAFSLSSMMNNALSRLSYSPPLSDDKKFIYYFLDNQRTKPNLLKAWLDFFGKRIDSTYLNDIKENIEEFLQILIQTYSLFRDFYDHLKNNEKYSNINDIIQNLKRSDYPIFKKDYEDTIEKVLKLVEDNSEILKEFKEIKRENYKGYSSLPEW